MSVQLPPFQRLIDDYGGALYRFLFFAVGPIDAADCYQDTMVAALRAYPSVTHSDNLRGWLFTIAHHKVIDATRSTKRRPVVVEHVPEPTPIADAESDDELWGAVQELPDGQRDAVLFRFAGDLSYAEIAKTLDCSEPAARQRVRAGIAKLREVVK